MMSIGRAFCEVFNQSFVGYSAFSFIVLAREIDNWMASQVWSIRLERERNLVKASLTDFFKVAAYDPYNNQCKSSSVAFLWWVKIAQSCWSQTMMEADRKYHIV